MNSPKRTTGITIVALISFLYGGFGLLASAMSAINYVAYQRMFSYLGLLLIIVNLTLSSGMLATGLGLWQMKPWVLSVARMVWLVQFIGKLFLSPGYRVFIDVIALGVCIYLFFYLKLTIFAPVAQPPDTGNDPDPLEGLFSADKLELPVDDPVVQLKQAVRLIKEGKRSEAAQIVQRLLKTFPNNADVWYLVGYLQVDIAKKRSAYEKTLILSPNHQAAKNALANLPQA